MQTTVDVLEDNGRNLVVQLTGRGEGNERNVLKVPGRVKVKSIRGAASGGLVTLAWSGLTPRPFAVIGSKHQIGGSAPLPPPNEGRGDLLLSTSGFGPSSSYALTLELVRKKALPKPWPVPTNFAVVADLASVLNLDFVRQVYSKGATSYTGTALASVPGVTFTRASTGYALGSNGVLTSFAIDTPRVTDVGLLIEGAATNVVIRSQEVDNAGVWFTSASSIVGNSIAAPDGTTTADTLVEDGTNAQHYVVTVNTLVAGANTYSIFYKPTGRTWFRLTLLDFASQTSFQYFNASGAGAVGASAGNISASSITALANGYYRAQITATVSAGAANSYIFLSTGDGVASYQGDSASGGYLWGTQIEAASRASSYIATTTAAATRAADALSVTFSPDGLTGTATYGINSSTLTPTLTSPINLGSSGAGAWVGDYLRKVVIR